MHAASQARGRCEWSETVMSSTALSVPCFPFKRQSRANHLSEHPCSSARCFDPDSSAGYSQFFVLRSSESSPG
jgi:hypothetical protein